MAQVIRTIPTDGAGSIPAAPDPDADFSWVDAQMPVGVVVDVDTVNPGMSGFIIKHGESEHRVDAVAVAGSSVGAVAAQLAERLDRIMASDAALGRIVGGVLVRDGRIGIGIAPGVSGRITVSAMGGSASVLTFPVETFSSENTFRPPEGYTRCRLTWQGIDGESVPIAQLTGTVNWRFVRSCPKTGMVSGVVAGAGSITTSPGVAYGSLEAACHDTVLTVEVTSASGLDNSAASIRASVCYSID